MQHEQVKLLSRWLCADRRVTLYTEKTPALLKLDILPLAQYVNMMLQLDSRGGPEKQHTQLQGEDTGCRAKACRVKGVPVSLPMFVSPDTKRKSDFVKFQVSWPWHVMLCSVYAVT